MGAQLVAAVRERDRLGSESLMAEMMAAKKDADKGNIRRLIDSLDDQLATVNARIVDLYEQSGLAAASGDGASDG